MSGNTGVRLRGTITGGDESAGIEVTAVCAIFGRFLKKSVPPIIVPNAEMGHG